METLSPIGWAMRPLKRYAQFSGRAPRAEYWWFALFATIFLAALFFVCGAALVAAYRGGAGAMSGSTGIALVVAIIAYLAFVLPSLAVLVRRLHDIDRTGWWAGAFYLTQALSAYASFQSRASQALNPLSLILSLVAFAASIALLVFTCTRGTQGSNRFGPDPYGDDRLGYDRQPLP